MKNKHPSRKGRPRRDKQARADRAPASKPPRRAREGAPKEHAPRERPPAPEARRDQRPSAPPQLWIYGRHAVIAALANPARPVKRVLATTTGREWLAEQRLAPDRLARVRVVDQREIDAALHEGAVHQGLAAEVGDLPRARLKESCAPEGVRPVVVLDQITDPQNIGAIFRSAAAFGAKAVIVQDRRTPPRAGALAKAAAGAVEIVPCIEVVNIARALEGLKSLGYYCAGLAGGAARALDEIPAGRPIALVLGAEGAGLRRLVAETCDGLYRIPIESAVESLNVSTAAAVSLYAITRRKG